MHTFVNSVFADIKFAVNYVEDLEMGEVLDIGRSLGLSLETIQPFFQCPEKFNYEIMKAWISKKTDNPTWKLLLNILQKKGKSKAVERIWKG